MPTPRPVFVSGYCKSLFKMLPPDQRPNGGRRVANDEGETEVHIYSVEDIAALKNAGEYVIANLNPAEESFTADKRQISLLLGSLAVYEIVLQEYPYSEL